MRVPLKFGILLVALLAGLGSPRSEAHGRFPPARAGNPQISQPTAPGPYDQTFGPYDQTFGPYDQTFGPTNASGAIAELGATGDRQGQRAQEAPYDGLKLPVALIDGVLPVVQVSVCDPPHAGIATSCRELRLLVDTASVGVRVLRRSVKSLRSWDSRPAVPGTRQQPATCAAVSGTHLWGGVHDFQVRFSEDMKADQVPVQVIGMQGLGAPQGPCAHTDLKWWRFMRKHLLDGVLGIGPGRVDCGAECSAVAHLFPSGPTLAYRYFLCGAKGCTSVMIPERQQVANALAELRYPEGQVPGAVLSLSRPEERGVAGGFLQIGIAGALLQNRLKDGELIAFEAHDRFKLIIQSAQSPVAHDAGLYSLRRQSLLPLGQNMDICEQDRRSYCANGPVSVAAWALRKGGRLVRLQQNFAPLVGAMPVGRIAAGPPPADGDWVLGAPFFVGREVGIVLQSEPPVRLVDGSRGVDALDGFSASDGSASHLREDLSENEVYLPHGAFFVVPPKHIGQRN